MDQAIIQRALDEVPEAQGMPFATIASWLTEYGLNRRRFEAHGISFSRYCENRLRYSAKATDDAETVDHRAIQICEITKLAGCPERAAEFIANFALSPSDVRKQLQSAALKNPSDPHASWRADYRANEKRFRSKGIDEAAYIRNRKAYDKLGA